MTRAILSSCAVIPGRKCRLCGGPHSKCGLLGQGRAPEIAGIPAGAKQILTEYAADHPLDFYLRGGEKEDEVDHVAIQEGMKKAKEDAEKAAKCPKKKISHVKRPERHQSKLKQYTLKNTLQSLKHTFTHAVRQPGFLTFDKIVVRRETFEDALPETTYLPLKPPAESAEQLIFRKTAARTARNIQDFDKEEAVEEPARPHAFEPMPSSKSKTPTPRVQVMKDHAKDDRRVLHAFEPIPPGWKVTESEEAQEDEQVISGVESGGSEVPVCAGASGASGDDRGEITNETPWDGASGGGPAPPPQKSEKSEKMLKAGLMRVAQAAKAARKAETAREWPTDVRAGEVGDPSKTKDAEVELDRLTLELLQSSPGETLFAVQ